MAPSTRHQTADSANDNGSSSQGTQPQGAPPPTGEAVLISPEAWAATQASLQRLEGLEARLSERQPWTPSRGYQEEFRRPTQLKPKQPDVYKGGNHKDLYEFLRQCTEYFKVMNVGVDDPGSVAFAASFLRGDTSGHVWETHQLGLRPDHIVTWAEFKKVLRDDLGDEDAFIDKTWGQFFSYHQRANETVRVFAVSLQQLRAILQEYDPICAPTDSLMIRRVRHALRPEIRAALYNTGERVESYAQFLNKAMSAEASAGMQASARQNQNSNKRDRSRDNSPARSSNKRGRRSRGHDNAAKPTIASGSNATPVVGAPAAPPATITCYKCGQVGHKANVCTTPVADISKN